MALENRQDFLEGILNLNPRSWQLLEKYISENALDENDILVLNQKVDEDDQPKTKMLKAKLMLHGLGKEKNTQQAASFFLDLADKSNNPLAQLQIAFCYQEGEGVEKNPELAFKYFNQAAEQGLIPALFEVANCHYYGIGVQADREKVKPIFSKIEQLDDQDTIYQLANKYATGDLVRRDYEKAAKLYQRAAIQGHPDAQYKYARALEHGNGVEKNLEDAMYYYELAAKHDHPNALYKLGRFHEKGTLVKKNPEAAIGLYHLAEEAGSEKASLAIVSYYEQSSGNLDLAADYYFKDFLKRGKPSSLQKLSDFSEQGNISATSYLFIINFLGISVERDEDKAKGLYSKNQEILEMAYYFVSVFFDDLSSKSSNFDELAEFFITKSPFHSFLQKSSREIQKTVFESLLEKYKAHINSGYPGVENDVENLNRMVSIGIAGAAKTVDECASFQAERMSALINSKRGDPRTHLFVLEQLEQIGNETAKKTLSHYYHQYAKGLLNRIVEDKSKDALGELMSLAKSRPEADTVLGMYYLRRVQNKHADKKKSNLLFFSSDRKASKYRERAYECFSRAANVGYGLAYFKLANFPSADDASTQETLRSFYYLYKSAINGFYDKAFQQFKHQANHHDIVIAISAQLYLAILSSKDNSFKNNHFLKKAAQRDINLLAKRVNYLVTVLDMSPEAKFALLSFVLSHKVDESLKEKLKDTMKELVNQTISADIPADFDSLNLNWLKYVKTDVLINSAIEIASDHDKYSFGKRALILLAARRKAKMSNADTSKIDAYLSPYKQSAEDLSELQEKVVSALKHKSTSPKAHSTRPTHRTKGGPSP